METLRIPARAFGRRKNSIALSTNLARSQPMSSPEEREWTPHPRQRHSIIRQDLGPSSLIQVLLARVLGR